jgi:glycosyltransferase involved in cell wall biosynthesis
MKLSCRGLVQAMLRLLDDPAFAKRMGAAGRELIETQLSADRVTRQLESVYARVHAGYRRSRGDRA